MSRIQGRKLSLEKDWKLSLGTGLRGRERVEVRHNDGLIYSLVTHEVTFAVWLVSHVVGFGMVCVCLCDLWSVRICGLEVWRHNACSVLDLSFRLIRLRLLVFVPLSVCCDS